MSDLIKLLEALVVETGVPPWDILYRSVAELAAAYSKILYLEARERNNAAAAEEQINELQTHVAELQRQMLALDRVLGPLGKGSKS